MAESSRDTAFAASGGISPVTVTVARGKVVVVSGTVVVVVGSLVVEDAGDVVDVVDSSAVSGEHAESARTPHITQATIDLRPDMRPAYPRPA
jgi:hypothetical protein